MTLDSPASAVNQIEVNLLRDKQTALTGLAWALANCGPLFWAVLEKQHT